MPTVDFLRKIAKKKSVENRRTARGIGTTLVFALARACMAKYILSIDLAGFSKSLSTPWYSQLFRKKEKKEVLLQMLRPIHQKLRIHHALMFH
jgi:hypothetical protein